MVSRGRWGTWLDTQFQLSERSAQRYMRIADFVRENPPRVAEMEGLSLRKIDAAITEIISTGKPQKTVRTPVTNRVARLWSKWTPEEQLEVVEWLREEGAAFGTEKDRLDKVKKERDKARQSASELQTQLTAAHLLISYLKEEIAKQA